MQGPAHGALVAGVSSSVVAGWTRQRVIDRFEPGVEPPTVVERINNLIPLMAAGIGFTGLSTAVAFSFDKIELSILADVNDPRPIYQQIENHRELHSLPYLGGAIGAAHLIRNSSAIFGQWIASNLTYSELAEDIVDSLNDLADWIVNASGFGIFGHLIGDIPTKGSGGTALRLLKPITNHNFSLGWVAHNEPHIQQFLTTIGMALTAAAWSFTGTYAMSWEPPEKRIKSYLLTLNSHDNFSDVIRYLLNDLQETLNNIFQMGKKSIWSLPIFEHSYEDIHMNPKHNWFKMNIDSNHFGIESFDFSTLIEKNILPIKSSSRLDNESLYEQKPKWSNSNGLPLVVEEHNDMPIHITEREGVLLPTNIQDGVPIQSGRKNGTPLQSNNKDGMSL